MFILMVYQKDMNSKSSSNLAAGKMKKVGVSGFEPETVRTEMILKN